jgi:hypothetical protein
VAISYLVIGQYIVDRGRHKKFNSVYLRIMNENVWKILYFGRFYHLATSRIELEVYVPNVRVHANEFFFLTDLKVRPDFTEVILRPLDRFGSPRHCGIGWP